MESGEERDKDGGMKGKLRELLEQEPFIAFQIIVSTGDRFTVANPNLITFTDRYLNYYVPRGDGYYYFRFNQIVCLGVGTEAK